MGGQYGPAVFLVNGPPRRSANPDSGARRFFTIPNRSTIFMVRKRAETMAYKLDGAKFPTLEELVEALYPMYADKMSVEEFKKYAEEKAEKS